MPEARRARVPIGWLGLAPILLLVFGIEWMGRNGMTNVAIIPLPTKVLGRLADILGSGSFLEPLLQTSTLLFGAYFCAAALAIATGLLVGRSPGAYNLLQPLFELVRPLPKPALLPPLILLLGIG